MADTEFTIICRSCKIAKPASECIKDKYYKSGYMNKCKACRRKYNKIYCSTEHGQQVRARNVREWVASGRAKNYHRYYRETSKKCRTQDKAHWVIHELTRSGRLPPINTRICINCGQQAEHYHHHNGYDEKHRKDVVPVCHKCHIAIHRPPMAEGT
jgi:hypothetical protein